MEISDNLIRRISLAIATAEGFFLPNSRPARNHNPGDFEYDITGYGVGKDGPYIIYEHDEDGWEALHKQVRLFYNGSHIYNSDMNILNIASHWTEDNPPGSRLAWAKNVANELGVGLFTKLSELGE